MTKKPEIKLTHAENNHWYKFMVESAEYDRDHNKTRGYHWFWGIVYLRKIIPELPQFDIQAIQDKLPSGYLINETEVPSADIIHKALMQIDAFPKLRDYINSIKYTDEISNIDFSKLFFRDSANFSDFIFPIEVSFILSHFSKPAIFKNARFFENVNFTRTSFDGRANFEGTKFYNVTAFCDTTFSFFTNFIGAIFFNTTTFSGTKFLSTVQFTNATFKHDVGFDKITTAASAIFTNTKFLNSVPTFYNAEKLYPNIIWDRDVKLWPQMKGNKNDDDYKRKVIEDQNAYENLSSNMKKLDKYHDEHFFYRQEMRCRRRQASYPTKYFYWLYETFSDYGYGIERALLGWFLHIVLGTFLLFAHYFFNPIGKWYDALCCSFGVSFSNAHGFLSFHDKALKKCNLYLDELYWFNTIWLFQTVFGILFLFLLVLTVRIRFRLK